jgi:hypothetical protein
VPRDLLINAGAGVTGQWVRVEPPFKVIPYRAEITGTFSGDNVYLEELSGGLPVSPGPLQGNPGLLTAGSQTGAVSQLYSASAAGDVIIDAPVEFIRARTGPSLVGSASVHLVEAQ